MRKETENKKEFPTETLSKNPPSADSFGLREFSDDKKEFPTETLSRNSQGNADGAGKFPDVKKGVPYPLGATVIEDRINFAAVMHSQNECGVILYDSKSGNECKIPFKMEDRIGNICCLSVVRNQKISYEYNFYDGDTIITDPYAKRIIGNECWGAAGTKRSNGRYPEDKDVSKPQLRAGILEEDFDWQEDAPLRILYEDSVFYCTHVRGFTKSPKSGVKKKGTFTGVIEKIPYLQELGVKNIEFMPLYEFSETDWQEKDVTMQYAASHYMDKPEEERTRINYWGYCDAYYFSPKASYAATNDCVDELKRMIRQLHKSGIEVICQFYFPDTCKQGYILEVIKYWVLEYHIDGIHLMGNGIPVTLLATEPLLSNTKLIYYGFPYEQIYTKGERPEYRNLAAATDNFMIDARRFLKSDGGMLQAMMWHFVANPAQNGVLHYITNYYGFTLYDLVSYERKHNEANGEDNRDGSDYNYSWNCGAEGVSRKPSIVKLRMRWKGDSGFFRAIPYHSIGRKRGILPGFILPELSLVVDGMEYRFTDVYVAASSEEISESSRQETETVNMIINPRLFAQGKKGQPHRRRNERTQ